MHQHQPFPLPMVTKVKVTLRFRGREMAHQQVGAQLLDGRVKEDLAEVAQNQRSFPKMEGRQMVIVAPEKNKAIIQAYFGAAQKGV